MLLNKLKTIHFFLRRRKVVAQYKLYFGDEWLELSVDSIAPYVHKILLVISDIPWGEDASILGDDLEPIVKKLKDKYGQKIIIHRGSWNKQLLHVQAGLDYIKQYIPEATHCLYIDSDEVYLRKELKRLFRLMYHPKYFNYAIRINYNNFFKDIYHKIEPKKWPPHLVLFPIRSYIKYVEFRNVNAAIKEFMDLNYEHFSYVRKSDEKIRDKIEAHRESEKKIQKNWYENVWLKWTPAMRDFHPKKPIEWEKTVEVAKHNLPPSVVEVYESWGKGK